VRPIQLNLKPSRLLAIILAVASTGACLIVVSMPLPLWVKLAAVILVSISAVHHVRDLLLRRPGSLVSLEVNSKGELHVMRRDGEKVLAAVLPDSVVLPWLTVLNLRLDKSRWRRHVLITADRAEPDAFRQLRVWLRWGRHPELEAVEAEEA
jgi:toxin CptA